MMNYDTFSPFWVIFDENFKVCETSQFFKTSIIQNTHLFENLELLQPKLKKEICYIDLLADRIIIFRNDSLKFRGTLHPVGTSYLLISWPIFSNLDDVKKRNMAALLNHPASMITDFLIAKDVITKSTAKIHQLEVEAANKLKEGLELELSSTLSRAFSLEEFPKKNPNPILRVSVAGEILFSNIAANEILEQWGGEEHFLTDNSILNTIADCVNKNGLVKYEQKVNSSIYELKFVFIEKEQCINIYGNDISEVKRAEREAVDATKMKSNFLASMSHEIRTPINGIFGMAQVLENSCLNENQKEQLSIIKRSTKNLISIVNDILDISKIESGKAELEMGSFILREELVNACSLLDVTAKNKHLKSRFELDPRISVPIFGDKVKIVQVINNLVGNAIKFTSTGEVNVDVKLINETESKYVIELAVSDTGIGMKSDKLDKIFEPFVQLGDNSEYKSMGTGLGLAISKKYVELMDGRLNVDSKEGVGSRFWFEIELEKDNSVSISKKEDSTTTPNWPEFGDMRVLVAEDDTINQLVIKDMMDTLKIDCEIVEDGQKAVEKLKAGEHFDVILMDYQMPIMNGLEATEAIRKDVYGGKEIPIFALTARAMAKDKQRCMDAGMNAILIKPLDIEDLVKVLKDVSVSSQSLPCAA